MTQHDVNGPRSLVTRRRFLAGTAALGAGAWLGSGAALPSRGAIAAGEESLAVALHNADRYADLPDALTTAFNTPGFRVFEFDNQAKRYRQFIDGAPLAANTLRSLAPGRPYIVIGDASGLARLGEHGLVPGVASLSGLPQSLGRLTTGLNLVVWGGPRTPVAEAIDGVASRVDAVLGYDQGTQGFEGYIPGAPAAAQRLEFLEQGRPYWLKLSADGSVPNFFEQFTTATAARIALSPAAVVAAQPAAGSTAGPPPVNGTWEVVKALHPELGETVDDWNVAVHTGSPEGITAADWGGSIGRAIRFLVTPTHGKFDTKRRSEINMTDTVQTNGVEREYTRELFMPTDWFQGDKPTQYGWVEDRILLQFHGDGSDGPRSPLWAARQWDGERVTIARKTQQGDWEDPLGTLPIPLGRWVTERLHIKWTHENDGFMYWEIDGQSVQFAGQTAYRPWNTAVAHAKSYMKWGVYGLPTLGYVRNVVIRERVA